MINNSKLLKLTTIFSRKIKIMFAIGLLIIIITNFLLFWNHYNFILSTTYSVFILLILFGFGLSYFQLLQEKTILLNELKQSRFYMQTLLDTTDNAILILNKKHQVCDCNHLFENLFQISLSQIKNLSFLELKKLLSLKKGIMNKHKFYKTLVDVAGEKKEILYKFQTIYDAKEGKPIGNIAFIWNLTSKQEEEDKLQRQEKLAVIGQIAASIVHEIKNPLTTIQGLCQMIDVGVQHDKIQRHIKSVDDSVKDLNRIVGDFLGLARLRSPIFKEVKVKAFIAFIKPLLESSCFAKGVQLDFQISTAEQVLLIDQIQLKQIILNLFENALDAVAKVSNPMISIQTGIMATGDRNEVCISIEDNGEGMSEVRRKNAGTPFFTTKEKGTGLGLSLCFQMIREHFGRIQVESEENRGTTFHILLPMQE